MPRYDYQCPNCLYASEKEHPSNATLLYHCLKCGALLQKIISNVAFHLRGGGWAKDGYSKKELPSVKR